MLRFFCCLYVECHYTGCILVSVLSLSGAAKASYVLILTNVMLSVITQSIILLNIIIVSVFNILEALCKVLLHFAAL